MADLNTKTFIQLVQTQVAAMQARAAGLVDFAKGAILRAITESTAGVSLWLQAQILAVLAMTRLSTSMGVDADSYVADFGGPFVPGGVSTFERLKAGAAVGSVTFSRLTTTGSATVPVGSTVETADGSQRFMVIADFENGSWDGGLGGYVMGVGVANVTVPVVAVTNGSAGNVLAGSVTVITSAIPGVDLVTNALDFAGGRDAESDEAMKIRWRAYILSLREATPAAVLYHASTVQSGLKLFLVENKTLAGAERRGFFFIVADDGTGTPPDSLIQDIAANVDLHRAAGVEFAIYPPVVVTANVTMSLELREGLSVANEVIALADAERAVTDFLNSQAIGADLIYTQLYQIAYNASPDITKVASLTLNGGASDIITALNAVVKAGTVSAT